LNQEDLFYMMVVILMLKYHYNRIIIATYYFEDYITIILKSIDHNFHHRQYLFINIKI
jgi:hypothetical protein